MANDLVFSRRTLLKGAGALGLLGAASTLPIRHALAAGKLTVGFIYVGPRDDYGYNQAHAQGAAAVKAAFPGVTVLEEENVPETIEVQKTIESMINLDGAQLIFPTSFGYYDPHVMKMAAKYPEVTFLHCGGLWAEGHPANAHSYFGYIDEAQYLSGVVAGHATQTKKLGFIAAKPIPQVLRNINAFTLGARSVDPAITTQVIFTGDWSMPVKEAEATNSLADQGADVVTCHVDSPKVIVETAERRGMFTCGYHASQAALAPKGYLTGAEWNWEVLYPRFVADIQAGTPIPSLVRGGLKEMVVKTSAYGAAAPDAGRQQADAVKAAFMAGDFAIFKGPVTDNKGGIAIPAGTTLGQTDILLEKMDYLVEGVIGATA
ncbi:BMP family ABC transporter substrate-binding protein [Tistrella sp. BH-R2-4]|uniref:BMP family ABC transporter substrate-binding protein n=1 Tax=Tistrella arctica TaxID=3133430 RepID=A0ABU9YDE9_9PROT